MNKKLIWILPGILVFFSLAFVSGEVLLTLTQQQLDDYPAETINAQTLQCKAINTSYCNNSVGQGGTPICIVGDRLYTPYTCLDIERYVDADGVYYEVHNDSVWHTDVSLMRLIQLSNDTYGELNYTFMEEVYWFYSVSQALDTIDGIRIKFQGWQTPEDNFWEDWQGDIF